MKYIFITSVEMKEIGIDEYEPDFHCHVAERVDQLLEEYTMSVLADEKPSGNVRNISAVIQHLQMAARFNPQRDYKLSVVIFEDEDQEVVDHIIQQMDKGDTETIKMIRRSGDTRKL
tara:strand:- start:316 stop:666 length:351 start_codon:yes stop_codon:yes gene_type:complete